MMAFTFLMTVSLVAVASAGFPGWPDKENTFTGFNPPMMSLRFGPMPSVATMPGMPKFPSFPAPAPLLFNTFPPLMAMPSFPPLPSIQDIAKGKGGSYNGVVVSTQSESKRNEDGTVVKKGGSTILINNDGKVTVTKTGDAPPEIVTESPDSSFDSAIPKVNPFKPFQFSHIPFQFNDFSYSFPTMRPIDPEQIKKFVPQKNEHYVGSSVSSHSYVSDVNGKRKEGGSVSTILNDNGKVKEENIAYHKD